MVVKLAYIWHNIFFYTVILFSKSLWKTILQRSPRELLKWNNNSFVECHPQLKSIRAYLIFNLILMVLDFTNFVSGSHLYIQNIITEHLQQVQMKALVEEPKSGFNWTVGHLWDRLWQMLIADECPSQSAHQ